MGHADFLAGRSGTVDGLVRWRAADSPDKVYAESGSRAVTYGDLDATAGGLAGALTELGVGKGDFVAIYMNNGLEYALSMFACFRLGAVCVPCSTHYTADELALSAVALPDETRSHRCPARRFAGRCGYRVSRRTGGRVPCQRCPG